MNTSTERHWFKSSYSSGSGDSCVEVAGSADAVHVRDSKVEGGPELGITPLAWASFLGFATATAGAGVR